MIGAMRDVHGGAADEAVREACKKASLHDIIMTLPGGCETAAGEPGSLCHEQRTGGAR